METVTFKLTRTAEFFVARLEHKQLGFLNGTATAQIERGKKYELEWFVRGAPGTTYKFEITSPDALKFADEETLDAGQKAGGVTWLQLDQEGA